MSLDLGTHLGDEGIELSEVPQLGGKHEALVGSDPALERWCWWGGERPISLPEMNLEDRWHG